MKDLVIARIKHIWIYVRTMAKWLFLAIVSGVSCGLVGTLFHFCVDYATSTQHTYPWLLYLLPVAGVLIVLSYRGWGVKKDEGTNLIISSVRSSDDVPANMTVLIFIGTVLTHLCGGSAGREGAALQIGGSMGSLIGRIFHLDENEKKMIIMNGMSALFAALFGTPLTATVFSMEVISVGVMNYAAFFPCIVAAIIAVRIAALFHVETMSYTVTSFPDISLHNAIMVGILAILCSIVSALFVVLLKRTGRLFSGKIENAYIRVIVGGCIIIVLTLLMGTRMFNGVGTDTIALCFTGHVVWYAFLMKALFTAITIGSGFKGGEIIPSFFIGACFGNVMGDLLGLDPSFAAALGLVVVFCGVVNCPMASVILSVELFGSQGILFFALACAIAFIASGYNSLYATQNFVYSKLPLDYVDDRSVSKRADVWNKRDH